MKINKSKLFDQFFDRCEERSIKHLVLHHIAADNIERAIELLKDCQVSCHYIIGEGGEVFQIVDECDIAYHAGHSYWNGQDGLNKTSIGIEFFNKDPYGKKFTDKQIESGIKLCQEIIKRYGIEAGNVVAHSDIAYDPQTGLLNRKDDPSFLFPWKQFFDNGIGFWPDEEVKELVKETLRKALEGPSKRGGEMSLNQAQVNNFMVHSDGGTRKAGRGQFPVKISDEGAEQTGGTRKAGRGQFPVKISDEGAEQTGGTRKAGRGQFPVKLATQERNKLLKQQLKKLGYQVKNLDDNFDQELLNLIIVFNRRFFLGSSYPISWS